MAFVKRSERDVFHYIGRSYFLIFCIYQSCETRNHEGEGILAVTGDGVEIKIPEQIAAVTGD